MGYRHEEGEGIHKKKRPGHGITTQTQKHGADAAQHTLDAPLVIQISP